MARVKPRKWSFIRAATWSDWVRSGPPERTKFHRGTWHYVNRPYIARQHTHTEGFAILGDDPAKAPVAKNPKRLSGQLPATETVACLLLTSSGLPKNPSDG